MEGLDFPSTNSYSLKRGILGRNEIADPPLLPPFFFFG